MKFDFQKIQKPSPTLDTISDSEWTNWTWQIKNSLKNLEDFQRYFSITESEKKAFLNGKEVFHIRSTPYYACLANSDSSNAIRKIQVPVEVELLEGTQQMLDPLGERINNPAPRIIHRYSDRALFLVTDFCSVYCRFCTRKHFTGQDQAFIKTNEYEQALSYIKSHPGIREVILSGGDPLTLSDSQLDKVLRDLRKIEHIEIIRIGSRMPTVNPFRITDDLIKILKKAKPVYFMTHFNHPKELTFEAASAIESLVDNGVPVMNQMVLLRGINNHPAIVQALSRRLLYLRAKPYYMFQCDPSIGTDHFRISIEESEKIQMELWGHLSGLAMPNLSLDIPHGGGKTYLVPNFEVSRTHEKRTYKGWDGVVAEYINPKDSYENDHMPNNINEYIEEWNQLKHSKN